MRTNVWRPLRFPHRFSSAKRPQGCQGRELNPGPLEWQAGTLTIELRLTPIELRLIPNLSYASPQTVHCTMISDIFVPLNTQELLCEYTYQGRTIPYNFFLHIYKLCYPPSPIFLSPLPPANYLVYTRQETIQIIPQAFFGELVLDFNCQTSGCKNHWTYMYSINQYKLCPPPFAVEITVKKMRQF